MNLKKYEIKESININCWICGKKLFVLKAKEYPIELNIAQTPENYDIELYCPDCKESCMYSFNSENENYYEKKLSD